MANQTKLTLIVVSQERELLRQQVDSVTAPAQTGEVTILPQHVPLFTPVQLGELIYRVGSESHSVVVSKGFMDVGPDNTVTVMVDAAVHDRDISMEKAQQAVAAAKQALISPRDREELIMAEASLRRALLEMRVAQKSKKTTL